MLHLLARRVVIATGGHGRPVDPPPIEPTPREYAIEVYEGQLIGIHSRDNDLVVNPLKGKKLTNVRASGKDDAILLTPPIQLTLEYAVEFIADDELVEVTPQSIRIRKRFLKEHERKRASRESATAEASDA